MQRIPDNQPITIDPLAAAPDGTVLYDGTCVLCSRWFQFVAARDPAARFRFVAIQSARGAAIARRFGIDPNNPDTNAVVMNNHALLMSDAILAVTTNLPGWGWTRLARLTPRPIRNAAYRLVARNRYRLFGKTETCMMPAPGLERHLLDSDTANAAPAQPIDPTPMASALNTASRSGTDRQ